jgi:hypothetical protein
MAAHGEIGPMPDCAIFADTGWEPQRRLRSSRMADVAERLAVPGPYRFGGAIFASELIAAGRGQSLGLDPGLRQDRSRRQGSLFPVYDEDDDGASSSKSPSRSTTTRDHLDRHDPSASALRTIRLFQSVGRCVSWRA